MTQDYTVMELRQIAKSKGLRGYSNLRKVDLFKLLSKKKKGCN